MFRDTWPADRSWVKTIAGFSVPIVFVGGRRLPVPDDGNPGDE